MDSYEKLYREFHWHTPEHFNFGQIIDRFAADPKRVALLWEDQDGNRARLTFADIRNQSNRIANVLVETTAFEPGNRVLLRAPNTPMLAACWFAVLKAGGIVVTTVPQYRAGELRFIMEKAQVKHVLCDVRLRDDLEQACNGLDAVQALCRAQLAAAGSAADARGPLRLF